MLFQPQDFLQPQSNLRFLRSHVWSKHSNSCQPQLVNHNMHLLVRIVWGKFWWSTCARTFLLALFKSFFAMVYRCFSSLFCIYRIVFYSAFFPLNCLRRLYLSSTNSRLLGFATRYFASFLTQWISLVWNDFVVCQFTSGSKHTGLPNFALNAYWFDDIVKILGSFCLTVSRQWERLIISEQKLSKLVK